MTSSNGACIRPISVMSLLADQMKCSSLTCDNEDQGIPINSSYKYDVGYKIIDHSNSSSNFSTSVPSHRHSFSSGCCSAGIDQESVVFLDSDLLSPELPPKRKCQSVSSANNRISRPIPIKMYQNSAATSHDDNASQCHRIASQKSMDDQTKCQQPAVGRSLSNCNKKLYQNQRASSNVGTSQNRPVIFAHKKSAFISTRSLTSPHTSSSDYSISPDIESPIHRPDSVTSSGFHDCSQQSLLIDPNYSPDANQRSGCATIINKPLEPATVVLPRCHSQPCYEPVSRGINNHALIMGAGKTFNCQNELNNNRTNSQLHVHLKRRYPSLTQIPPTSNSEASHQKNSITPMQYCFKRVTSSADTSPSAYGPAYSNSKRDGHFFGNSRSYLVSLPRIASSPTPISPQSNANSQKEDSPKECDQQETMSGGHRQRMGSNSSSLSTSTTTDTNTPTVISNTSSMIYLKMSTLLDNSISTNKENLEDVEMMDSDSYPMENRAGLKVKLDYHSHSLSNGDGLYNITLSSDKDQLQFWEEQNFIKSRHSSVSVTSDMTTKSYSTNSDGTSNDGTNASNSIGNSNCESSRSEYRDPDDPPEIVGDTIVNNVSAIGFCFRQLTNHSDLMNYHDNSSFQELDLDQIELD